MQRKMNRIMALFIVVILLFSAIMPHTEVWGKSTGVQQTRRIAGIAEFPESYQTGLARVKAAYPNAKFIYYDTDLDWYEDLLTTDNELYFGRNLISSSSPESWKSSDPSSYDRTTGKYKEVEPGWNVASQEIIEYYMDPRNFFNETDIFQFINLGYDPSQTVEGVKKLISGTFMERDTLIDNNGNQTTYAEALVQIGQMSGVSPYLLATRIRQEQGGNGSAMITGNYSGVPGYYNHFNIGAYGPTTQAILTNGLNYAKRNGWDTPYKSLLGGARVLASSYVGSGQNCLYLHHWNVVANENGVVGYGPYMASTASVAHEARNLSKSYNDNTAAYTFIIPVYKNMPDMPCDMPSDDMLSYKLKNLTLNSGDIDIGFQTSKNLYTASCNNLSYLTIRAEKYNANSKLYINGIEAGKSTKTVETAILLQPGFNDVTITVMNEDGVYRDYMIRLHNNDGNPHYRSSIVQFSNDENYKSAISIDGNRKTEIMPNKTVQDIKKYIEVLNCTVMVTDKEGNVKSDDELCISSDKLLILNNNILVYEGTIFIKGDINQDGIVDHNDTDNLVAHMLGYTTLPLDAQKASDVNQDGIVDIEDLGEIRLSIGDYTDLGVVGDHVTVSARVPDAVYCGVEMEVDIDVEPGPYYIKGWLLYNEGKVDVDGISNSGRIPFIVDAGKTIFPNMKNTLTVTPLLTSGNIDFGIEIEDAYNYVAQSDISISTKYVAPKIESTDMQVILQCNAAPQQGDKHYQYATLKLVNMTSKSMGNIELGFGDYFVNEQGKNTYSFNGLTPGASKTIKLYVIDDLVSGDYVTQMKLQYHDANYKESLTTFDVKFTVENHVCEFNTYKDNNSNHIATCSCGKTEESPHTYKRNALNYECVYCHNKSSVNLEITQPSVTVGQRATFSANMMVNDTKASNVTYEWWINGKQESTKASFTKTFDALGRYDVSCIARTKSGLVAVKSFTVQPKSNNALSCSNITCNSISVKAVKNHEYKLVGPTTTIDWQTSNTFKNLECGTTYTLSMREKGTNKVTSIKVIPGHKVNSYTLKEECSKDLYLQGSCLTCKAPQTIVFSNTAHEHLFLNYKTTALATCTTGTKQTATCEYGCGTTGSRVLNDKKSHSFSSYVFDKNESCVSGGTMTAQCEYGCGAKDKAPVDKTVVGHLYTYSEGVAATRNSDAVEKGVCRVCGHINNKTIYGSRLNVVDSAELKIVQADTTKLPTITTSTPGLHIKSITWVNHLGQVLSADLKTFVPQPGEKYMVQSIVLECNTGYCMYEDATIYINGHQLTKNYTVQSNQIIFENIVTVGF